MLDKNSKCVIMWTSAWFKSMAAKTTNKNLFFIRVYKKKIFVF